MSNQILKLSGEFNEPLWYVYDGKSRKLISDGLALTRVVSDAYAYTSEEKAQSEITSIVQHPESYPQLPNALALRVVGRLEAKRLVATRV